MRHITTYSKQLQILLFLYLAMSSPSFSQVTHLIDFEMKDQFDSIHTDQMYRGGIIVLIASDRGGSEYNDKWARAIYGELKEDAVLDKIKWLAMADVSGAPSFLQGFIRGFFPKERESWVVLDWEGLFPQTYSFESDVSNILVFDPSGKLVYQGTGTEVEAGQATEIATRIKALD